jgi:hypothetical protein
MLMPPYAPSRLPPPECSSRRASCRRHRGHGPLASLASVLTTTERYVHVRDRRLEQAIQRTADRLETETCRE